MQFKSLVAAALFGAASAVEVIPVLVGMNANGTAGTFFSPDKVTAPIGSMVQFQFMGGNHTVTQSTFDDACTPISAINASAVGVSTGFVPAMNAMQTGQIPVYSIMINDTRPIWLYCAQGRHCQSGMVMVINENTAANSTRSLENHRSIAANAQQATLPTGAGGAGTGTNGGNNQSTDPAAAAGALVRVPAALLAIVAGAAVLL
ncbi:hypothetical protein jhhlp_001068 [Lomentospora prolificans]|uniref:Phytocyanin domain-containing protein n=1 Tax=Lomentospora prolificans TaxID=41688 RepID=A0A2N3NH65_9PEZI|nr:hypothetical protein jhhlp_001068 [Lomentospora prolificans]